MHAAMQLSHLKIIVTGAAQGMGAHFARRLAEAGAQVAAGDVNEDGLAALVEATQGLPGKVHARKLDVVERGRRAARSSTGRTARWAASTASSTTPASCATACS